MNDVVEQLKGAAQRCHRPVVDHEDRESVSLSIEAGIAEVRKLRAQLDEERKRSREVNWLRARVAEQARMLARVATQCDEACKNLQQPARKAVAEIGRLAEQRTTAEQRPQVGGGEFYYGHGNYLVVTQEDGEFLERPMTAVERAAVAPAGDMAADIYRYSNYAGVCYIWIWERIVKAFAGFVSPEEHDRRVSELLAANNREVDRRRAAERLTPTALARAVELLDIGFGRPFPHKDGCLFKNDHRMPCQCGHNERMRAFLDEARAFVALHQPAGDAS